MGTLNVMDKLFFGCHLHIIDCTFETLILQMVIRIFDTLFEVLWSFQPEKVDDVCNFY